MSENRLTNTAALLRKIRNAVQQCEMNCAKYLQCLCCRRRIGSTTKGY
jgi:hypothetical protein